jgi:hypothetical protein
VLLPLWLRLGSSTSMAVTSAEVGRPSMLLPCSGSGVAADAVPGSASIPCMLMRVSAQHSNVTKISPSESYDGSRLKVTVNKHSAAVHGTQHGCARTS